MWIFNLLRAFSSYRRFRRNQRYLSALDDHILKDIGMSRADIVGRAWELAKH